MLLYEFDKRKKFNEKPCGQILTGFAMKWLTKSLQSNCEKFSDMLLADKNTNELCEIALNHKKLRIFNLRTGTPKKFADLKKSACPHLVVIIKYIWMQCVGGGRQASKMQLKPIRK
jgi:hypothetical protein